MSGNLEPDSRTVAVLLYVARGFRLGPLVYLAATLVAFINPGRIPGRPTL